MHKLYLSFLFFITVSCLTSGCSHSIKVDVARQSSDLNHCEYIFGSDLTKLKNENAILLQIGVVDTTDEQAPIPIAIIIIDKKEVILKLMSSQEVENNSSRTYEGEGYKLVLHYKREIMENGEAVFTGDFLIENKSQQSEYKVVGVLCNL